jgi:hypothetical protein
MDPDSLINRIIPTTDSLNAAVMDDFGWYKISTYCNVEGDAWWLQLLIAFAGALGGGFITALVAWYVDKTNAKERLQREQARDNLLKELEDHRDKRQNIWRILQTLQDFSNLILEADKYATVNISVQMQIPGARNSILFFGELVDKIEFLWKRNSFLLSDSISQSIKKIIDWMNAYKLQAMHCTTNAPAPNQPYTQATHNQQTIVNGCIANCQILQSQWNSEWDQLSNQMKQMRQELL